MQYLLLIQLFHIHILTYWSAHKIIYLFQIIIKSNIEDATHIIRGLKRLTPTNVDCPNVRICHESECVQTSESNCILEKTMNGNFYCNWAGSLPKKCRFLPQL